MASLKEIELKRANLGLVIGLKILTFALVAAGVIPALFSPPALAAESCWNSDRTFYDCSSGSGAVGVSAPVVGDTLESNPANLPTEPSPLGLELTASDRSAPKGKAKIGVSTVKGFDGLGFGVGSWSKGTFSAPDFAPHYLATAGADEYRAYEFREKWIPGIRLGTTVLLPKFFLPKAVRISVGGSVGFGQVSGDYSPQLGVVMRIFALGLGYSESLERLSKNLPRARVSVLTSGIFLGPVYAGFSYSLIRSSANRTHSKTYSLRIPLGAKWVVHGAWKYQRDYRQQKDVWPRAGLMRRLSKKVNVGYEYGYYRYSHSVFLQYFL